MTEDSSGIATAPSSGRARFVDLLLEHEFTIAFAALTLLVVFPVFLVDVPPLADYVNHLARMRVISVEGIDPDLSAFYRIDWQLIPNLAMDLIVPVLDRFLDIYRAGQIFTVLTLIAMVTGPMAVHKALYGRLNAFPLVAFVLVYNGILLYGMMNYLLGVGLAMWGLAVWVAIRGRSILLRLVVSAVFCFLLYVCHLYAVGLYGLAIGSYELWAWSRRGFRFDKTLLLDLVVLIVPVLPLVPLLMRSSTWGLVKEAAWDSQSKIDGLELVFRTYVDTHDLALMALGGVALAWALKRGVLSAHGAAAPLAGLGFAVFLAMPYTLFGSEMADQRMPVALLLMLVGFVHLDPEDKWFKAGFLALVVGFAGLRVADVSSHWQRIGAIYTDLRASLVSVPRGSKILVSVADEPKGTETAQTSISHAPCLAMIERSALVSTAFTVKGKQIMTVRPAFHDRVDTEDGEPPRVSQLVAASYVLDENAPRDHFWDKWTVEDDYVVVLYTEREADNPDPSNLDLVWDGRNFQLYKVKKEEGVGAVRPPAPVRTPG